MRVRYTCSAGTDLMMNTIIVSINWRNAELINPKDVNNVTGHIMINLVVFTWILLRRDCFQCTNVEHFKCVYCSKMCSLFEDRIYTDWAPLSLFICSSYTTCVIFGSSCGVAFSQWTFHNKLFVFDCYFGWILLITFFFLMYLLCTASLPIAWCHRWYCSPGRLHYLILERKQVKHWDWLIQDCRKKI